MEKHILIIDDDPGIRDVLKIILTGAGYQTTIYSDAGVIMHERFTEPDMFLIDKQLPYTDGTDVCRFLKHRRQHACTPVILFSAGGSLEKVAVTAGADGFLEKPFKIDTLLNLIEKHIGIRSY